MKKNEESNGKVFIFKVTKIDIKYYNSDTISIIANLAKIERNFSLQEVFESLIFNKQEINNILKIFKPDSKYKTFYEKEKIYKYIYSYKKGELLKEIVKNKEKEDVDLFEPIRNKFNKHGSILRLYHEICNDKKHFFNIINPSDFNNCVLLKAKQNNPRIIKQSGAFFIFGIDTGIDDLGGNTKINNYNQQRNYDIIIPAENKEKIKKELKVLNITYASLFPDLQNQAEYIKNIEID